MMIGLFLLMATLQLQWKNKWDALKPTRSKYIYGLDVWLVSCHHIQYRLTAWEQTLPLPKNKILEEIL